jgi:uncharacterized protein YggU (UPF0235/DUF167 family)
MIILLGKAFMLKFTTFMRYVTAKGNAIHLQVRVKPDCSATELGEVKNQRLVVHVQGAREKGEANQALLRYFHEELGMTNATIVQGMTSVNKVIMIKGVSQEEWY